MVRQQGLSSGGRESSRATKKDEGRRALGTGILALLTSAKGQHDAYKRSAAALIHKVALLYQSNLLNRYVLFIPERSEPIETFYSARNFQHLCGYDYRRRISPEVFFEQALANTLSDASLVAKYVRNTRAKMRILPTIMHIDTKASTLIRNPVLPGLIRTDAVCIHVDALIGYRNTGAQMVPCTALQMNGMIAGQEVIIGVVKTEPTESSYTIYSKRVKAQDPKGATRRRILAALKRISDSRNVSPSLLSMVQEL